MIPFTSCAHKRFQLLSSWGTFGPPAGASTSAAPPSTAGASNGCSSDLAQDLAGRGWQLNKVLTDNASPFTARDFEQAPRRSGAKRPFIRAGRSQTNRSVERAQQTILEECWAPSYAGALVPKSTPLERDPANPIHPACRIAARRKRRRCPGGNDEL